MSQVPILGLDDFGKKQDLQDFYCSDLRKHLLTHSKNITAPHKHNFFLVVLFTRGTGLHEVDFEKHDVTPGSVFMLNPGQAHHWKLSDDIEGVIFFHTQEFFEVSFTKHSIYEFPFFSSVQNPSMLHLSGTDKANILGSFDAILSEYQNRQAWSSEKIVSLLHLIYIDLSRFYINQGVKNTIKESSSSNYIRRLEQLIEAHHKVEKSPKAYADWLNITIRHLNRLTQETLEKSTTQLITERVILEAKRLIVYNPSSLASVSFELGYEDYAYFSRLFKKWTGVTPKAFSKMYERTK